MELGGRKKGISVLISTVIITVLTLAVVSITLFIIRPTLNKATTQNAINEATDNMRTLDRLVREVASEGRGSFRSAIIQVSDGRFIVRNDTGIEYIFDTDYNIVPAGP